MRIALKNKFLVMVASVMVLALPAVQASSGSSKLTPLQDKVRHALVTLPYESLFDDLSYRVDGTTVSLFGQVTQPFKKSDAEKAVKRIEGVTQVNNQIEVLPLSPMDEQLRVRTYRAVFKDPSLQRYAMGVLPSIHIIVKNGNVKLTGIVSTEMDRTLAYMRANGVFGAFSVTNDLQVQR
jgi:hyperosmotically inducible protein